MFDDIGHALNGLFWFAIVGMAATAAVVLIGIPLAAWWAWNHIAITW